MLNIESSRNKRMSFYSFRTAPTPCPDFYYPGAPGPPPGGAQGGCHKPCFLKEFLKTVARIEIYMKNCIFSTRWDLKTQKLGPRGPLGPPGAQISTTQGPQGSPWGPGAPMGPRLIPPPVKKNDVFFS